MFQQLPVELEDLIFSFGIFKIDPWTKLWIHQLDKEKDDRYGILSDLLKRKKTYEFSFIWHNCNLNRVTQRIGCIIPCNLITGNYLHIQQVSMDSNATVIRTYVSKNSYFQHEITSDDETHFIQSFSEISRI
jgi:hypothetical protein